MSTAGGSNPEYVIARVRARRSALFGDEEYRKLVRMGPAEIARFMEESEYENEVNALGSRFSGVDLIEFALNQNLAKQFNDILDWAGGRLYDLIARYLRKFDAWNIKTIIRGIYSDTPRNEVEADLIRAGEFDDKLISRLLDASELEEIVDLLSGTIFGDGLEAAYEDYEEVGVLVPLENAVDRAFYEQLLEGLVVGEEAKQYREFLEAEIDFRNARNALRIARSGADLDPVDYFIEGGTLFRASEIAALATSPDELVSKIRDSRYGDRLSSALSDLEEADSLIGFERALDAALLEYGDSLGHVYPLSVTPIVSYILAKEREVDNIRAIARGREAGLDPDAIEEELVIL
ncbi:V-type ATP synthase subunit C [Haloferax mediterranei ATCC 33500]|uniref:A-type ATP synthase subunit C n=1 Tax=Haloferax mediterranei (strain ATCC 33500 / DSM 1411 / JCM 8866 / NBRC 14739 / NCIMB 2177 / R-4) TaxID=523841 RepID=I3R1C9_HALMT|nr:V-type ATP synthase subunit C [Haloferax mediterranei]AFK18039.1 A-type ATP synthase subunit C [Haloferax mediterranei ATCC 33500]AHZ22547.1 ATP synthase subunit C [Haloferax mediterranei ATCC 33500]EMA02685.1 V-type ATP synthase subunit C [Haloferax mediterranei ATCC 33500]MDX5988131.1 V-type ATP synthase subunit C [Haloferax mediterranei ATCC 33500]QCQ74580.1 V-type ATP synthase subunit C [Haloferax mediterranei ATCC 33500]